MYTARIRMPRMGTSVHESTVVAWKKAVGDQVAKGEVLLSAESDKVEFEVEAPADGMITEILARKRMKRYPSAKYSRPWRPKPRSPTRRPNRKNRNRAQAIGPLLSLRCNRERSP